MEKSGKLTQYCLSKMKLPSDKKEFVSKDVFTLEKLFVLYQKICPREDVEKLHKSMWVYKIINY